MKTKRTDVTQAVPSRETKVFDEMDRVLDTMMHRGWMHPFHEIWPEWRDLEQTLTIRPRVDVIDRETEVLAHVEVPGVEKDDLEVNLTGDLLTIKGQRKQEQTEEEGGFLHAEIARGGFSRTIRLPAPVALEGAAAKLEDGVLEIHLPKTEKTERRRIDVN